MSSEMGTNEIIETVNRAAERTGSRYFFWDEELIGFGMRVEASGRKTFLCRYRSEGVRRQYTLG